MRIIILTVLFLSVVYSKILPSIVYNRLPAELISVARKYGAQAYQEFLEATANETADRRIMMYDDYFMQCNNLGQERALDVYQTVYNMKATKDIKLLLTLGFNSFAARFVSLDEDQFRKGLNELCEKYEMQLQCQLGFGESRTAIYWRIDELKNSDGNLRILLEKQCSDPNTSHSPYDCFAKHVSDYTSPCFEEMLAYNYTRYSAGRRIARIHIKASNAVDELTRNKELAENSDQFLTLKEHVQTIFTRALKSIAEIEGEKCDHLNNVLKCVMPLIEQKCGREASQIVRTSILVGYLTNQRREPLSSQFKGFDVDANPKCLRLHPNIV